MDLATLWYLTTGTALIAAIMTLWERKAQAQRARELGLWAAAYLAFAVGCVIAMNRHAFPGMAGPAITNIVMMLGYFLMLQGALALDGRRLHPALILGLLAAIGIAWFVAGVGAVGLLWNHVSAFPIAIVAGSTAFTLLCSRTVQALRSRPIAVAVFACHALFYAARTFVVPVIASIYGESVLALAAEITMYEAVLFTVAMSMSLLALVREEDRANLLATARTDFLTDLNNRQGFFELAPRRLSGTAKDAAHSLLAFDLDHFKAINDRYGHEAGDRVLKLFATIAREIAGADAMSARLGGEEFAILLPNRKGVEAHAIGQRIAQRFAEMAVRPDGLGIPATVSIGLAEASGEQVDLATLLAAADRALYRAKMLGRNRIEMAQPGQAARAA
ncbi:MAG TPA: GGDEF domain-containing protein [Bosea sp. (in: a-proteobacteria)]|jgi:diguanylate cyclase (GGDEF)-like protein|uniref:GGDEF domain-containing protein n=1 Tax=Bosea sp. (in: a-proteobacteria) TaxID=1871050 RepID=UPI002E107C11|nr:GGDEF domain-containing protein [Bosea sp. (in: a-proteobacteria)]